MHTHLIVRDTNSRHCVGVRPHIILHELDTLLLQVLTTITELLPAHLPFGGRLLQLAGELGEVPLVTSNGLLHIAQLLLNLIELLSLDQR